MTIGTNYISGIRQSRMTGRRYGIRHKAAIAYKFDLHCNVIVTLCFIPYLHPILGGCQ